MSNRGRRKTLDLMAVRASLIFIGVALLAWMLPQRGAAAGGGLLDLGFGNGGKVLTGAGIFNAIVIQPDGKIVAGGESAASFALIRYNIDGSLDPGFGNGGLALADFGPGLDAATALVIRADGKLLAAGTQQGSGLTAFAVALFNSNGTLDTSFGNA